MNKWLFVTTAALAGAVGFTAYTQFSSEPQAMEMGVPIATIHETMERDEYEMGQFRLAAYCEQGLTMPHYPMTPCQAAYEGAYQRADFRQALHFATLGCLRDNKEMQCRKAIALALRIDGAVPQADATVAAVSVAAISEAIDRNESDVGQFGLGRFCELGFTVPGHSMSACQAAYVGAYQRGEIEEALHFASIACKRDKEAFHCRKVSALAPRIDRAADILRAGVAREPRVAVSE